MRPTPFDSADGNAGPSHRTAHQRLVTRAVHVGFWPVSAAEYDVGYIDLEQRTLQPLENPFGPSVAAARAGVCYLPAPTILGLRNADFAIPRGRSKLIPDQLFALNYCGGFRAFVSAGRGSCGVNVTFSDRGQIIIDRGHFYP